MSDTYQQAIVDELRQKAGSCVDDEALADLLLRASMWIERATSFSSHREHEEASTCWCKPTLNFVADDGSEHWIHHEPN
jgi:hypothetical protein